MVLGAVLSMGLGWAVEAAPSTLFPCQNGWARCRKDGVTLDASGLRDGQGMPIPADARLGWFDLDPTPMFDPFDTGSDDGSALVLVALELPEPTREAPRVAQPRTSRAIARTSRRSRHSAAVDEVRRDAAQPQQPRDPAGAEERSCGEHADLEVRATLGRLTPDEHACLQGVRAEGERMLDRIQASEVLIADAWGRGDTAVWADRTSAHLQELDRSNAELCRTYAVWAERNGRPFEAIRWAETALENRHQWSGGAHVIAVDTLHATRARAASALWTAAGRAHQASPTPDAARAERDARNRAKEHARAWLDYARSADRPVQQALALCASAAGTEAYCAE